MADEKWITALRGMMPVGEAARRILTARIGVVVDRLPSALSDADDDIEHVHQLRVGTRRAGAALRIFKDRLPGKLYRRARRALRSIRRAAGAARDWDVFLDMLGNDRGQSDAKLRPGFDFLLGVGQGQRVAAQASLRDGSGGQVERLQHMLAEIPGAIEGIVDGQTLRDLAIPVLTQLVSEFEEAMRGDLRAYAALHAVRILGKQLRYAMELFESCFAPAFRDEVYPRVTEMQDILGRANDSHVTVLRLAALGDRLERTQPKQWPRYRPALERLQRIHRRRLPAQRRLFAQWWDAWQSANQSAALARLLRSEE